MQTPQCPGQGFHEKALPGRRKHEYGEFVRFTVLPGPSVSPGISEKSSPACFIEDLPITAFQQSAGHRPGENLLTLLLTKLSQQTL